jgi:hypothetical protein
VLGAFEFWGLVRMTRRRGNSVMTWSSYQTCYAAIRPLFYLKAPSAIALQADSNQYLHTCIKAKAPSPSRMNTCEKRGGCRMFNKYRECGAPAPPLPCQYLARILKQVAHTTNGAFATNLGNARSYAPNGARTPVTHHEKIHEHRLPLRRRTLYDGISG